MKYCRYPMTVGGIMLVAVFMLAGCGDDVNVSVEMVKPDKITVAMQESDVQEETEESREPSPKEESYPEPEASGKQETSPEPEASGQQDTLDNPQMQEADASLETVSITISAAGDVTLGNYKGQDYSWSFRQTYDQTQDKGYFFENVLDIFAADDMTIVNLEGTLTLSENAQEGRTYNIKGDPEYAYLLNYGSVEAVSMGNNHRQDYGEEGTSDTVKALEQAGIPYAYDKNLGIYETEGIRIGWVSVNEVAWGRGVEQFLEDGIGSLKEEGVNLILASCHWGVERDNYPEDYQKELGRKCIDWGADLVLGHHPHVLQGIDQYHGKYIVYSLANFCFGANRNPADKDTMIFQQTFSFRKGEGGGFLEAEPGEARVIPCSVSSVSTRNDFRPTPLSGEEGERVIGRINEYSREFGVTVDKDGVVSYAGQLSALE